MGMRPLLASMADIAAALCVHHAQRSFQSGSSRDRSLRRKDASHLKWKTGARMDDQLTRWCRSGSWLACLMRTCARASTTFLDMPSTMLDVTSQPIGNCDQIERSGSKGGSSPALA